MPERTALIVIAIASLTCLGLHPQTALADKEAVVAYVSLFNDTGRCDCYKGDDPCDTTYNGWASAYAGYLGNKLEDWYSDDEDSRVSRPTNMGVTHSKWADINMDDTYGADHVSPYGTDLFDVAFIYSHGGLSDYHGSRIVMGAPSGGNDCSLNYGGSDSQNGQDVEWGDQDLNYLIAHSCGSLDWWESFDGWYYDESVREPNFSMLMGFHGYSMAGYFYYLRFTGFVDGTQWNGLGEDWVDEITEKQEGADICATALVYSDNANDSEHIFMYGGFEDYQSGYWGEGNRSIWGGEDGCNPGGADPLP